MDTLPSSSSTTTNDQFPILGTHHIEFYVGNAKQAAYYYQVAFGFSLVAYRGPETGTRDTVSYVLQQGKIRFVFTGALSPEHPVSNHVRLHGDGVKVLALWVEDAQKAFDTALANGAKAAQPLQTFNDHHGTVR
ncbi:MAG: VOC family protein, partial [Saprospiraceae bacterium]|nr:VOC family protein [Saprospiraceae bacterium]